MMVIVKALNYREICRTYDCTTIFHYPKLESTINNKSSPGRGGRKYHDTSFNPFFFAASCKNISGCATKKTNFLQLKSHIADEEIAVKLGNCVFAFEDLIKFLLQSLSQVWGVLILNYDGSRGLTRNNKRPLWIKLRVAKIIYIFKGLIKLVIIHNLKSSGDLSHVAHIIMKPTWENAERIFLKKSWVVIGLK